MRLPQGPLVLLPEASSVSDWLPVSLRFDAAGPELRCRHCQEWWPLTFEYWMRRGGHVRIDLCRSCKNEQGRLYQALRRHDPEFVESEKRRHKRSYRKYRQWIRRNHPDLLEAYNRELRETDRATQAERRAA